MSRSFSIGEDRLTADRLGEMTVSAKPRIIFNRKVRDKTKGFRAVVERVVREDQKSYGITTGFGFLSDVSIPKEKVDELQLNLIRSHACGVGPLASDQLVRAVLVLRAHTFAIGHSGVRPEVIDLVLAFLQHDILPEIPIQGSVGASGDLAPLAHVAMGLLGEGRVKYCGESMPAKMALERVGLQPLKPVAKEGLALINGTHFMTAMAAMAVAEAKTICKTADIAGALSLDAIRGTVAAFDPRVQDLRPHRGQADVAANLRELFATSDLIMDSHRDCGKVQDPYSFRCIPQVHGATRDVVEFVEGIVDIELNSVTDNPLIFENGDVISAGNFHGQYIAQAMDMLGIAVAEIGSIAERRIEKITNPHLSGLPPFATVDSGMNSGFMIPHVVAAALASENKSLAHPASVDSIPTSADKEDHVSMGPIAARQALQINDNVRRVLAIEMMASAQGVDLLAPLTPGAPLKAVFDGLRKYSAKVLEDRSLSLEIEDVAAWIHRGEPIGAVAREKVSLK